MSALIARLMGNKKLSRKAQLALVPAKVYDDGRTKQCYKDECDINKIMARAEKGGTISHINKHQGSYADYSDYDFHENTRMLTQGREIFDDLPAEVRQEFGQSPAKFFAYVNDPKNKDDLLDRLPALAAPGRQYIQTSPLTADQAARAAASELASETSSSAVEPTETPPDALPAV